jgi:hypothetical protein
MVRSSMVVETEEYGCFVKCHAVRKPGSRWLVEVILSCVLRGSKEGYFIQYCAIRVSRVEEPSIWFVQESFQTGSLLTGDLPLWR